MKQWVIIRPLSAKCPLITHNICHQTRPRPLLVTSQTHIQHRTKAENISSRKSVPVFAIKFFVAGVSGSNWVAWSHQLPPITGILSQCRYQTPLFQSVCPLASPRLAQNTLLSLCSLTMKIILWSKLRPHYSCRDMNAMCCQYILIGRPCHQPGLAASRPDTRTVVRNKS